MSFFSSLLAYSNPFNRWRGMNFNLGMSPMFPSIEQNMFCSSSPSLFWQGGAASPFQYGIYSVWDQKIADNFDNYLKATTATKSSTKTETETETNTETETETTGTENEVEQNNSSEETITTAADTETEAATESENKTTNTTKAKKKTRAGTGARTTVTATASNSNPKKNCQLKAGSKCVYEFFDENGTPMAEDKFARCYPKTYINLVRGKKKYYTPQSLVAAMKAYDIYIHPDKAFREFENIELQTDTSGNVKKMVCYYKHWVLNKTCEFSFNSKGSAFGDIAKIYQSCL